MDIVSCWRELFALVMLIEASKSLSFKVHHPLSFICCCGCHTQGVCGRSEAVIVLSSLFHPTATESENLQIVLLAKCSPQGKACP